MKTYRIDFCDSYLGLAFQREYIVAANIDAARNWAIEQNISSFVEVLEVKV